MDDFQTTRSSAAVAETPECDGISVKERSEAASAATPESHHVSAQQEDSACKEEVPQMAKSNDNDCSAPSNGNNDEHIRQQQQQIAFLLVQLYSVFYVCTKISKFMRKTVLIIEVPNIFALRMKCWWLLVSLIAYGIYQLWIYIYFLNEVLRNNKITNTTNMIQTLKFRV